MEKNTTVVLQIRQRQMAVLLKLNQGFGAQVIVL